MSLTIKNLSKTYGKLKIIDQFSAEIHPGEIVMLLGRSGTGKTTFLRILNRLEKADRGTIAIDEAYLTKDNGKEALYNKKEEQAYLNKIGMVFQNYALFPHLTVLKNMIEAPLDQKKMTKNEAIQKAEELLDFFELKDKMNHYPSELSGGQKQRVAIARAMMLEPEYLCFDEPTSALDRASSDQVGKLIQRLAENGTGIVIITHDEPFAQSYGTKILHSEDFLKDEPSIKN